MDKVETEKPLDNRVGANYFKLKTTWKNLKV